MKVRAIKQTTYLNGVHHRAIFDDGADIWFHAEQFEALSDYLATQRLETRTETPSEAASRIVEELANSGVDRWPAADRNALLQRLICEAIISAVDATPPEPSRG